MAHFGKLLRWYAVHDPVHSGLFLLLMLAAAILSFVHERNPPPAPASFDLLAVASSPNLNDADREQPPIQPGVAEAVRQPVVHQALDEPELLPLSVRQPDAAPAAREPVVPALLLVPTSQAGESIMLRTWKLAGWPALLALTAAPALAAEPPAEPDKNTAVILKKLDELQKSLEGKLKQVQEDQLNDRLQLQKATQELASLKEQVGQLRKDLDALKSQSTTRVAMSPATTSGRIQLVNVYPEQMTVVVNTTAYRLAPGEVRNLEAQPAGPFVYQVLGVQTVPQPRLLAANQTFTISVIPR